MVKYFTNLMNKTRLIQATLLIVVVIFVGIFYITPHHDNKSLRATHLELFPRLKYQIPANQSIHTPTSTSMYLNFSKFPQMSEFSNHFLENFANDSIVTSLHFDNLLHSTHVPTNHTAASHSFLQDIFNYLIEKTPEILTEDDVLEYQNKNLNPHLTSRRNHSQPMKCQKAFPSKCKMYYYVRFWNYYLSPQDCYESPLRPLTKDKTPYEDMKYVVFEPDRGGWNNIRMAAEVVMVFAHATGRTLVLPAPGYWYLLTQSKDHEDNLSSFEDYYDLEKVRESMTIISMVEFLEKVAKKPGLLKATLGASLDVNTILRPREKLCEYLEKASYSENWEPGKQFIAFNFSRDYNNNNNNNTTNYIGEYHLPLLKHDKRYIEMVAHGRKLRPYNQTLHNERVIYFPGDYRHSYRILTHFYSYLYWTNVHLAKLYKRLVRDRLHYHDIIFCAAGLIVHKLHEESSHLSQLYDPLIGIPKRSMPTLAHAHLLSLGGDINYDATYYAFHIRRGDFQYSETRLDAETIWNTVKHLTTVNVSRIIYISTDEKNHLFFKPFENSLDHVQDKFQLRFFSDYEKYIYKLYPDLNPNMIGMIEQVVCANAHTFVGTPRSSFTGYIARMRGYYRDNRYQRTYYTMDRHMYELHTEKKLVGPFWAREFEIAHRNADDYYDPNQRSELQKEYQETIQHAENSELPIPNQQFLMQWKESVKHLPIVTGAGGNAEKKKGKKNPILVSSSAATAAIGNKKNKGFSSSQQEVSSAKKNFAFVSSKSSPKSILSPARQQQQSMLSFTGHNEKKLHLQVH
jgi:hypothetical protein